MKKIFFLFVILLATQRVNGRVDHFPSYMQYYCFENFNLAAPSFGIYVNGCQYHDKVTVYILDKSSGEYVQRDEYLCPATSTYGSTYVYLTSNIYQDYLKYGSSLEYKTVIFDNYGNGSTWTSSFIMNIDKYNEDISTVNISQTCNTLSMNVSRNNGSVAYQWYYSSTEGGEYEYLGNTTSQQVSQSGYYKVRLKPERCDKRYTDKFITVPTIYLDNLSPGSISNSATGPVCDNESLQINEVNPATGGNTLTYLWYGSDDQINWTNMYLSSGSIKVIPKNVKQYLRRAVSSCDGTLTAQSNIIQISKIPELVSGGTINGDQSICYNTSPGKLTGSEATGGGTVTYIWQWSEDNLIWSDIPGANQVDYGPGALTKTTYFRRVASSTCGTKASNTVTVNVFASLSVGNIASDQVICYNTVPNNIVGTTPGGGYGNYAYNWYYSYDNTNWEDAKNTIRDYQPSALKKTVLYRRKVTDNCGSGYSNTVTITVNSELGSINITGDQSVCYGATINTLVGETPSGAGGTFTFKWQSSTDKANWFDIPNTNSKDYQPTNLTQTTYFRRVTSTTSCGMANSNNVKITVSGQLNEGTITGAQQICEGTKPNTITGTAVEGITYQWQSSSNGDVWENIPGWNTQNFAPSEMTSSRYFRRAVTSGCGTKYSNSIFVTVYPKPSQPVVSGLKSLYCRGEKASVSIDGTLTYSWYDKNGSLLKTGKKFDIDKISEDGTVSVKATDSNNCKSDALQLNFTVDKVKASFTTNATSIKVTEFVQFTSNSVNASSFLWDFSEGEKSSKENPIKYFYNAGTKTIRLTVTSDGSCKDSVVMQSLITVNGTTGVDDLSGKGLSVYPNPFASELVIETVDPGNCYIYLLSLDGKVMQSTQVENTGKATLGCASLPRGIYMVKIQKGNDIKTLKVVKQ